MTNYVVLVDTSNSMACYLDNIKEELNENFLDWLSERDSPPRPHRIALISFNDDVHILSHHTRDVDSLKPLVDGLERGGATAYHDAILVGLVFGYPRNDELWVWSDHHDTCSDASEATWKDLSDALGVDVELEAPKPWWQKPGCTTPTEWQMAEVTPEAAIEVTFEMAVKKAEEIAARVPRAMLIRKPEDRLKLKPVKKKK